MLAHSSGHPCLGGKLHPTPGLLQMDVVNVSVDSNRSSYPITGSLLLLLRNPGKLYDREEIKYIEQNVFLFISLTD